MKSKFFTLPILALLGASHAIAQGKVGIGTASPQAKLQINHRSGPGAPAFMLVDSGGNYDAVQVDQKLSSPDFFVIGLTPTTRIWGGGGNNQNWPENASTPCCLVYNFAKNKLGMGTQQPESRFDTWDYPIPGEENVATVRIGSFAPQKGPSLDLAIPGTNDSIHFFRQRMVSGPLPQDRRFVLSTGSRWGNDPLNYKFTDVLVSSYNSGHVGIGVSDQLPSRLNIGHRSTGQSTILTLLDSSNGSGNMVQFRRRGSNQGFGMVTNLTDVEATLSIGHFVDASSPYIALLHMNGINKRVGIGTSNPQAMLDVNGSLRIIGVLIAGATAGQPGQVLTSQGANAAPTWEDIVGSGKDPDTCAFHAFRSTGEDVTPGADGKVLGIASQERFDNCSRFNSQTGVFTAQEGLYHVNARVSIPFVPFDGEPYALTLLIETLEPGGGAVNGSYESYVTVPTYLKANSRISAAVNTLIHLQQGQQVRVRVKHQHPFDLNIRLDEFSAVMQ